MEFKIHEYKWNKNRKLDFFNKENLIFANIENKETFWADVLLEWLKWKEKIILIKNKVISDIFNIIKLPNWTNVIEVTLSDFWSFNGIYLDCKMNILKTNKWEIITSLWKTINWEIEAEINRPFISIWEMKANEKIFWILNCDMEFKNIT